MFYEQINITRYLLSKNSANIIEKGQMNVDGISNNKSFIIPCNRMALVIIKDSFVLFVSTSSAYISGLKKKYNIIISKSRPVFLNCS